MRFFLKILLLSLLGINAIQGVQPHEIQSSQEILKPKKDPFVFIVFGATGDLTARKLLPAMYNLAHDGHLSPHMAIVGFARGNNTNQGFRKKMEEAIAQFSRSKPIDSAFWTGFQNQVFYHQSEFENDLGYEKLDALLKKIDEEFGTKGNRIFFLATHPSYFPAIIKKLHDHKLIDQNDKGHGPWSRVILEKPFGSDLASASQLQAEIGNYLADSQVYRMDHYLGKEGVQNLLAFRFESSLFEPLWNYRHIDHVQITLGEEIGIGSRGRFWEETGSLRDVFQNHLMQLLAILAMEPPASLKAEAIQTEKLNVLKSIRPFPHDEIDQYVIRGQYGSGLSKGVSVPGYRDENGVDPSSAAETFVAAKLFIDNGRWKGVPFYIRGGKRMAKQTTEILVTFKKQPLLSSLNEPNALLIRIQPQAGIFLKTLSKVPDMNKNLQPVIFGYQPDALFNKSSAEAYEKLIFDCSEGDDSLFVKAEEQIAAWTLLTPVLEHWKKNPPDNFPNYDSGSWGPEAADRLLEQQGHKWQIFNH